MHQDYIQEGATNIWNMHILPQRHKVGCTPLQTFPHPPLPPLAAESSRRATRHALKSPSTSRLLTHLQAQMQQNPSEGGMETYQTSHPIPCEPSSELPDCVQASTGPSSQQLLLYHGPTGPGLQRHSLQLYSHAPGGFVNT